MTDVTIDEHGRPEPPMDGDERATLLGYLNYQRATFEWKTRGLSADQLARALAPTSMTLAGMLGHLAYVEDFWFSTVLAQEPAPAPWNEVDWKSDEDWDWHQEAQYSRELWRTSIQRSDAVIERCLAAGDPDALGARVPAWGGRAHPSGRWILAHMIEEYARHNGHADLLRESIDGHTGE